MGPVSGLSMVCTWRRHLKEPKWMLPLVLWQLKQAPKTFYSQTERFAVNIALHIFSQSPDEAVSCFLWTVGLRKKLSCLMAELANMQKKHKLKYSLSIPNVIFLLQCTTSVQFRTITENQTRSVFQRSVSDPHCFFYHLKFFMCRTCSCHCLHSCRLTSWWEDNSWSQVWDLQGPVM